MSMLFQDRKHAGKEIAIRLKTYLMQLEDNDLKEWDNKKIKDSLVVLAIPRGGVVLGDIIASEFHCNLDIVVSKKIGAPFNKELAMGAVMPGGSYFINEYIVNMLDIPENYIHNEVEIQKREIERRLKEFRGKTGYDELSGKIVILVDDGIATGATIIAASQWIKEGKHRCKKLIVASPVAPDKDETIDKLNQIADKVIILYTPKEFSAVGQFYKQFDQVTDYEVKAIMDRYTQ
jgi:putative phosphoribosyl transferase